jgi:hypothetical protein
VLRILRLTLRCAAYPISFLVVQSLPEGGAPDVLKLVNAGVLFDPRFELLGATRAFTTRLATRVVWQTTAQVVAVLRDTTEAAVLAWLSASFHFNYWPRVLDLRLEWQPGGRGVWLHLMVYNPVDDTYALDACKGERIALNYIALTFSAVICFLFCLFFPPNILEAMVVGIDGGHVEWSPLRHRHFPNEIRDAILTLLLCHRFRRDSPLARLSKVGFFFFFCSLIVD